jgi:gluconolactonase
VELVARPNFIGNGMVFDGSGDLLVCEHVTSTVVRIRPGGDRQIVAYHYRGSYLNSPNDVVTRSDGTIYFTDPDYGRWDHAVGVHRRRELDFLGLFSVGTAGELRLAAPEDTFDQPNGLCFSPDEAELYVDDRRGVKAFGVAPDGTLSPPRQLRSDLSSRDGEKAGDPDGMKCDAEGNLWCTGRGGVWILRPSGELLGVLETPEIVANLAWGGPDWRTLFLCTSTTVHALPTRVPSAPLPYHTLRSRPTQK